MITAAFWKIRAEFGKELQTIHRTAKNVMVADFVFTIPGIILLLVPGNIMMVRSGYSIAEWSWLSLSMWLFIASAVIWIAVLLPSQARMVKHSAQSVEQGKLTDAYRRASRTWDIFGVMATVIPLIVLYLMVVKPEL